MLFFTINLCLMTRISFYIVSGGCMYAHRVYMSSVAESNGIFCSKCNHKLITKHQMVNNTLMVQTIETCMAIMWLNLNLRRISIKHIKP